MRLQNSIALLSLCAGGLSAPVINAEGRVAENLEEGMVKREPQGIPIAGGFRPVAAAPVVPVQPVVTQPVVAQPVVAQPLRPLVQPVLQPAQAVAPILKRSPQLGFGSQSVVTGSSPGGGSHVSVVQTPGGAAAPVAPAIQPQVVASPPIIQPVPFPVPVPGPSGPVAVVKARVNE